MSYVWSCLPTEVVIWKVVLPKGTEVKGTEVGETRPMVHEPLACISKRREGKRLLCTEQTVVNLVEDSSCSLPPHFQVSAALRREAQNPRLVAFVQPLLLIPHRAAKVAGDIINALLLDVTVE